MREQPAGIIPRKTYAEGIAVGKPVRGTEILCSMYPGEQEVILAPEEGIPAAREDLARKGFFVEHTTAAVYKVPLKREKKFSL